MESNYDELESSLSKLSVKSTSPRGRTQTRDYDPFTERDFRDKSRSRSPIRSEEFARIKKESAKEEAQEVKKYASTATGIVMSKEDNPEQLFGYFSQQYQKNDVAFDVFASPISVTTSHFYPSNSKFYMTTEDPKHNLSSAGTITALQEVIKSAKPLKVRIPKRISQHVSDEEYWQLFKELSVAAALRVMPAINLYAVTGETVDNDSGTDNSVVDLPGVFRNTLAGSVLQEADYLLKVLVHNPSMYVKKEYRRKESQTETVVDVLKGLNVQEVSGVQGIKKLLTHMEAMGGKRLDETFPNAASDLKTIWQGADALTKKFGSMEWNFTTTKPDLYINKQTGEIASSGRATLTAHYYTKEGKEVVIQEKAQRDAEALLRSSKLPYADRIIAMLDLIYILYPVARSLAECGVTMDFSNTPSYRHYKTETILPPLPVIHPDGKTGQTFGGCDYLIKDGSIVKKPEISVKLMSQYQPKEQEVVGGGGGVPPRKITGYTFHGLNQAIGRDGGYGVKPSAILNTVKNAKDPKWQENRGTYAYKHDNTKVWLDSGGKVRSTAVDHDRSKYRNSSMEKK